MSEAEYEITRLGGRSYGYESDRRHVGSKYDKNKVNPINGVEKYLLSTDRKFKHLYKRNTQYSWTKSRLRDITKLYVNEELDTHRKSHYKRCKLIQEDFKRFRRWVEKQELRDMEWY